MATFYGNIQKNSSTPAPPVIDPDTLALWRFEGNGLDSYVNGYDLSTVGTLLYPTDRNPPVGINQVVGPFADANYYTLPAGVNTALSSTAGYYFETYVYLNSLANQPVILYGLQDSGTWWIQPLSDTTVKAQWGGAIIQTATFTIATGAWYHIAFWFHSGSGLSKLWVSPAGSISQTPKATGDYNRTHNAATSMAIGRYVAAGSFFTDGYLKNARFSLTEPSTIPMLP